MTILFCNIAWMKDYGGRKSSDHPLGGGRFPRDNGYCGEECDFVTCPDGHVYGHFETRLGSKDRSVLIERLGASTGDAEVIRNEGFTMTTLSLGQAVRSAGVGKTAIVRAVSSGRLSARRNDDGGYQNDPSELWRGYDTDITRFEKAPTADGVVQNGGEKPNRSETPVGRSSDESEIRVLHAQIQARRELIADERERREEAESDGDQLAKQAERLAGLLPSPSPVAAAEITGRSGLIERLFVRRAA